MEITVKYIGTTTADFTNNKVYPSISPMYASGGNTFCVVVSDTGVPKYITIDPGTDWALESVLQQQTVQLYP